jgi:hypothetical protein
MKTEDLLHSAGEIAAASPLFLFAPLYRHFCSSSATSR